MERTAAFIFWWHPGEHYKEYATHYKWLIMPSSTHEFIFQWHANYMLLRLYSLQNCVRVWHTISTLCKCLFLQQNFITSTNMQTGSDYEKDELLLSLNMQLKQLQVSVSNFPLLNVVIIVSIEVITLHFSTLLGNVKYAIGEFHANVWRNFNDMQMIFSALSGSSSQVPVTPIGANQMYYALWE